MKSSHSQEKSPELNSLEVLARNKRAALISQETASVLLEILAGSKLKLRRAEIRGAGEPYGEVIWVPEFVIVVNKIH